MKRLDFTFLCYNLYILFIGGSFMAISNVEKRTLTCRFCPKRKPNCKCDKYWKRIYRNHREEILEIYRNNKTQLP